MKFKRRVVNTKDSLKADLLSCYTERSSNRNGLINCLVQLIDNHTITGHKSHNDFISLIEEIAERTIK